MLVCLNLESSVKLHLVNKNHRGTSNSLVSVRQPNTCTTDFCGINGNSDYKELLPSVPEAAVSQWQIMISLSTQKEKGLCKWK